METTPSADAESKSSASEIEAKPEKVEDIHQDHYFICDLCDKELAYKIAQDLLSGLATACVDNTTGVLFKTPASVAAEIRKEMVAYLTVRSESFVAETMVVETDPGAEAPDHPLDILSNMIDDFAVSKKSLFSRVSGLMLTEMREDRIDEFTQGMERDSFWLLDKRESVAQTLIKNVDFKNLNHCNMKFSTEEEVIEHHKTCGFRPVMCDNEGCNDTFSFDTLEHHDSTCPFKILPCEQNCSELLMRRDMDKHCITDCSMKLANCPFYSIGCQTPVPNCLIKKHCSENTHGHLLNVLQYIHKDASTEDAERWAEQIEKSQFSDQLEARDVRTFTMAVKDIEKRIGPFEVSPKSPETVEDTPAPPSEEATSSPPPAQATTTPPTDSAAATPSKERDIPIPSTEREVAPRDVPSLSPKQDTVPPPSTTLPEQAVSASTQNDTKATPSLQGSTSSPATTPTEETERSRSLQLDDSSLTTRQEETKSKTETTPSEKVVTTEEVAAAAQPEPRDAPKIADVQEQGAPSPSTHQSETAPSLEKAEIAPPQQPES